MNDVAQVIRRNGSGFVGDERWPTEVAALGGFAVTLRAVCLEDWIPNQGRARRWSLSEGRFEDKEQRTQGDD
jgi:hypothetical protein